MKRDVFLVLIGVVITTTFFYITDYAQKNNDLNSDVHQSESIKIFPAPVNVTLQKPDSAKSEIVELNQKTFFDNNGDRAEKVEIHKVVEKESDIYNFAIEDGFKYEAVSIGSSKEFDIAFEEQQIDHDWKLAVEDKILLGFTDAIYEKSAWVEAYECKYSLCRVEIKQSVRLDGEDSFKDYLMDAISKLNEDTNTTFISIPEHSKDKDGFIFFLMRQEVKSAKNS